MSLPNFLITGVAKSGTTALYHFLKQHPQVYMSSEKETNFFAFEGPGDEEISGSAIATLEAHEEQFKAASDEATVDEAFPWYHLRTSWRRVIWEDETCGD